MFIRWPKSPRVFEDAAKRFAGIRLSDETAVDASFEWCGERMRWYLVLDDREIELPTGWLADALVAYRDEE